MIVSFIKMSILFKNELMCLSFYICLNIKVYKMKIERILNISFFISVIGISIGAVLKIMHSPFGNLLLEISFAFYLVFAVLALYEVFQSNKIETVEKIMWTIGILFLGSIIGILYLLFGRKRIVNNLTNTNTTSSLHEN